jgi:hypothetical protein
MEIEQNQAGPHHKPYHARKKSTATYQTIFFIIGSLFLFLSFVILHNSLNWKAGLVLGDLIHIKAFLLSFCALFSISAFGISYLLKTETEAMHHLVNRAKQKIARYYGQKRTAMGFKHFFQFGHNESLAYKHLYKATLEKINDSKSVTAHLIEEIVQADLPESEQEELFNQAILELDRSLRTIIADFKSKLN